MSGGPRRIVVTGAAGLIGFHLRALLHDPNGESRDDVRPLDVRPLDHASFHGEALREAVDGADAIVHLAGMNRGDDDELERVNLELADRLIDALADSSAHLVFASSTHRDRDTAYGRSKRLASERFERWGSDVAKTADKTADDRRRYTELVLPNVFGEHGRPFHNSAVSTFCHLLATGEEPTILQDQEIEWLHAQRAARAILDALDGTTEGRVRVEGTPLRVSTLLERLRRLDSIYRDGRLPLTDDPFERDLFNTYRSYRPIEPVALPSHVDPRGRLVEVVQSGGGGQCFFSTTVPGITRGEHFHRHKFERFLVIEGRARIRIRRLFDDRVVELLVDGDEPAYVDMPTFHTHDLTNVGDSTLLTLFWADEIFDPERPDTVYEKVCVPEREEASS